MQLRSLQLWNGYHGTQMCFLSAHSNCTWPIYRESTCQKGGECGTQIQRACQLRRTGCRRAGAVCQPLSAGLRLQLQLARLACTMGSGWAFLPQVTRLLLLGTLLASGHSTQAAALAVPLRSHATPSRMQSGTTEAYAAMPNSVGSVGREHAHGPQDQVPRMRMHTHVRSVSTDATERQHQHDQQAEEEDWVLSARDTGVVNCTLLMHARDVPELAGAYVAGTWVAACVGGRIRGRQDAWMGSRSAGT